MYDLIESWKPTGYWFSPDFGVFKEDDGEYIFLNGRRMSSDSIIRMMPISKEQYESDVRQSKVL